MTSNPPDHHYADFTSHEPAAPTERPATHQRGRGHGWLMWRMPAHAFALIGVLIATGTLGVGALCMPWGAWPAMAIMMTWMNHTDRSTDRDLQHCRAFFSSTANRPPR
ncbi:MAG: hypothetical protein IPN45_03310 [Actinomycetales bacterium]|nr:hypothetical protein [Actinomycetales bacterium]